MGEVTNAYPIIRNNSNTPLTNVCATLSASDEGRAHPDKTACVSSLPAGYQVTFKLTVDTNFRQATIIRVDVTSQEGVSAGQQVASCRDLDIFGEKPTQVGTPEPIHQ
jgi:hypothetical protein